jgi:uncharacterized membrane protein YgcG
MDEEKSGIAEQPNDESPAVGGSVPGTPAEGPDRAGIGTGKGNPRPKPTRKQRAGVGIAAVAVILAVGGCAVATGSPAVALNQSTLVDESDEAAAVKATVEYDAPGKQDGSTPAIVRVQGTTDGNRSVEFAHALSMSGEQVELTPGSYTVTFVGIVNPDGSIERSKSTSVQLTVAEGGAPSVKGAYEHVDASDVADGEVEKVVGQIADAIKRGDATLVGDAGKKVSETAAANAKRNDKVDSAKVDESKAEADEAAETPSNASTGTNATASGGASGGSSTSGTVGQASQPASGDGSGGSGSASQSGSQSSGGSESSGGSSEPAQEQHVHSYAPVYRTETSSHEVVDREAYDEPVYTQVARDLCNGCNADITEDPWSHIEEQVLSGNYACGGYHTVYTTEVTYKHRNAVTHTETVSEQVLDHYECPCGARQ